MSFVDARAFAKQGEVRHFLGEGRRNGRERWVFYGTIGIVGVLCNVLWGQLQGLRGYWQGGELCTVRYRNPYDRRCLLT